MQTDSDKLKSGTGSRIVRFNRDFYDRKRPMSFIGTGSFGGKAQGLINIHDLLQTELKNDETGSFVVDVPVFTVIASGVFEAFIQKNRLLDLALSSESDQRIAHAFQKSDLPFEILGDLRTIVSQVHHPLAIRSSGMLEDTAHEPFAGVYATKMTPNNQHDPDTRFRKLVEAVKYVYASTYFNSAKTYRMATGHTIEDEKMAVIIQEVVGCQHDCRFYPEVSGVARSYNFYPLGRSRPRDGVVNLALGLGKTIVDGGLSWIYAPPYPRVGPPFAAVSEMLKRTQNTFWAVNMGKSPDYDPLKETEFLLQGSLSEAEQDGTLRYTASTVDSHSGRLSIGTGATGARILNFAPLLSLKDIPFNDQIKKLLQICEKSLNSPVEIEFAVTLSANPGGPHRFGFLQVRPMVVSHEEVEISDLEWRADNLLLQSEQSLGNGTIRTITDIVYVKPEAFEARVTRQIGSEIERINKKLLAEKRPYLLIGFGRWGSSDPWLGIPVNWAQISGAKVIVETALEHMNVEQSQGSHFFHNMTSFQVSYLAVPFAAKNNIDWEWLRKQPVKDETTYTCHVTFSTPLLIKVDGRQGRGVIFKSAGDIDER